MALHGFAHRGQVTRDDDPVSNANGQIEGVDEVDGTPGSVGLPVPVGGPTRSEEADPGAAPRIEPEEGTVMKPLVFNVDRKRRFRTDMQLALDAGLPPGDALAKCLDMGEVYDGRVAKLPSFRRGMRDSLRTMSARDALARNVDAVLKARTRH